MFENLPEKCAECHVSKVEQCQKGERLVTLFTVGQGDPFVIFAD